MNVVCTTCGQHPIHARGLCMRCYNRAYKADAAFARHYDARGKTCRICGDQVHAQGLCQRHYMRLYRTGRVVIGMTRPMRLCTADGCNRRHHARGYCEPHYRKARRLRSVVR